MSRKAEEASCDAVLFIAGSAPLRGALCAVEAKSATEWRAPGKYPITRGRRPTTGAKLDLPEDLAADLRDFCEAQYDASQKRIVQVALGTLPSIAVHYGSFLPKRKRRPLVSDPSTFVEIHDTEEKGSDVNLAVHLVNDAWADRFDVALVLSQDTDLIEPLRIVTQERGKKVGLVWLDGRQPDAGMVAASTFVRHVRAAALRVSQFPDPIVRNPEPPIHKPARW